MGLYSNAAQQQIALVGTWTSIPDAPLVQKPEKAVKVCTSYKLMLTGP